MKRLKQLLILIGVVCSSIYGATLKEDCHEARLKVIEYLDLYDMIRIRNEKNQKKVQRILNQRYINRVLQDEIERDEKYLELSESIFHHLIHLKSTLDSIAYNRINLHVNAIKEFLSTVNFFVERQKDIFEKTLMTRLN
jgi:hypothetical protein